MAARRAWTTGGPHEVAEGVHRIPCPLPNDGLVAVNVYVVDDGSGVALIDCGPAHPAAQAALEAGLAALGATLADVTKVLCTHAHYDHYGGSVAVHRRAGASVLLGAIEADPLRGGVDGTRMQGWRERRNAWLASHGAGLIAEAVTRRNDDSDDAIRATGFRRLPDRELEHDDEIVLGGRVLRARLTPGHTRGHMTFVDENAGLLFAGDHVLPHITPSIGFEPDPDGRALVAFLKSLRATRDIGVRLVLPGHGPAFEDLSGRVDALLAHHERRLSACVAIVERRGPQSALAIASELPWTSRDRAFAELDAFNRLLAVSETIAHLELLALDGTIERSDAPVIRWAPAR